MRSLSKRKACSVDVFAPDMCAYGSLTSIVDHLKSVSVSVNHCHLIPNVKTY